MKIQGETYEEISRKGGGILKTVRATRKASKEKLVENANIILNRMLAFGTTTVEAKSGYGLTVEDELKSLEIIRSLNETHAMDIVPTFLGAHAVPPEYTSNPEGYVKLLAGSLIPLVSEKRLAEFCDVFCEREFFSVEQSRTILEAAKKCGMKLKVHADELSDLGGARLAVDVGAISADHLLHTSTENMRAMAGAGVIAILLPATPFSLMIERYADARKMINEGVAVAIATDLSPNSMTESMQMIITLACLKMKMLPEEAIVASTINAAHALDRAYEVGSIEVGKKADLLIADVPNYRHIPYHFGVNLVNTVIKNGKILERDGVLLGSS
jgi:imidazolonepropionase